ncbi:MULTISPECIES: GNAT family N-acetyltransferase [unclassified Devosia]|jgi:ribosomal protein S18 acetylase RimI-like enzyme|uniref:GNAT family N-acetyltransferase n=1 Tax=unclassified Devosia TaxID=196773 RepID=UPI000AC77302|nr:MULTISPECIES: GNAT family N-acetyltransferase [unclassified Devosia]MBN9360569.1 GNAT family N-acetyltransferase [Devosia sp.]
MLSIRPATAADLDALIGTDHVAVHSADRRDAIAEWVALGQCHLAARDGAVAGYVALTRSFFRSPFIEMLMVGAAFRRIGIGRALVEHCIGLTPPEQKLWTSTNESNAPMRALLPQLGFEQTGLFEHLDEGDPELIFLRWPVEGH